MSQGLPKILGSGIFDTSIRTDYRFKNTEIPTTLRTVREYELEFFCENGGTSVVNGQNYKIKKGGILIASPGDKRQSYLHFRALFIHFSTSDDRLKELIASLPHFIENCDYETYRQMFSRICDPEPDFDDFGDIADAGNLLNLLYALRKDCTVNAIRNDPADSTQSAVHSAVDYIRKHYYEPINAEFLARRCHLSTSYFYRVFTQVTDLSPNEFIIRTRLTAAQSLLASCDMPIVEVAERCGFNSQSYFSFQFKERFKMSPKEFRRKHFYKI